MHRKTVYILWADLTAVTYLLTLTPVLKLGLISTLGLGLCKELTWAVYNE